MSTIDELFVAEIGNLQQNMKMLNSYSNNLSNKDGILYLFGSRWRGVVVVSACV